MASMLSPESPVAVRVSVCVTGPTSRHPAACSSLTDLSSNSFPSKGTMTLTVLPLDNLKYIHNINILPYDIVICHIHFTYVVFSL